MGSQEMIDSYGRRYTQGDQQYGHGQPRFQHLRQSLVSRTIDAVGKMKGTVDPSSQQPTGTQRDTCQSFGTEQWAPMIQKRFLCLDAQHVIDRQGILRFDPNGNTLQIHNFTHGVQTPYGLLNRLTGITQYAIDNVIIKTVRCKGVKEEYEYIPRHDESIFRWWWQKILESVLLFEVFLLEKEIEKRLAAVVMAVVGIGGTSRIGRILAVALVKLSLEEGRRRRRRRRGGRTRSKAATIVSTSSWHVRVQVGGEGLCWAAPRRRR